MGRDCIASMGLYVFNKQTLLDLLLKTNYHDFGKEVFPAAIRSRRVQLHLFDDYWEDIGTIRAFYESNLALAQPNPSFRLADPNALVYTRPRFLPPSLMQGATVKGSLIADGCRIGNGTTIENSVIGLRTIIGEGVTIRNSVLMGADYYEPDEEQAANTSGIPVGIGDGSVIEGAILDKNCRIGSNVRVANDKGTEHFGEDEPCQIRDGVPVVIKNAVLPDGWKLDT